MGVLVNYCFWDLSVNEVALLGEALGKLTLDRGIALHLKMQQQIIAQEQEAKKKAAEAAEAKAEEWRKEEREKLKQELEAPPVDAAPETIEHQPV